MVRKKNSFTHHKLNKTEQFLKQNASTKLGYFLPTYNQYRKMPKDLKVKMAGAVRQYKGDRNRNKGFVKMLKISQQQNVGIMRSRRASNLLMNLETLGDLGNQRAEYQIKKARVSPTYLRKRRGIKKSNDPYDKALGNFGKYSKNYLDQDGDMYREAVTSYEVYEGKDGDGYIVKDKNDNWSAFSYDDPIDWNDAEMHDYIDKYGRPPGGFNSFTGNLTRKERRAKGLGIAPKYKA